MISNLFSLQYPLMSRCFEEDPDEDKILAASNNYTELLLANKDHLPNGTIYLHDRLHDSQVLSIAHIDDNLNIWLNDFSTHCFADAFVDVFMVQVPHSKRVFPICLQFTNVKKYSISRINRNGKIIPLKPEKYFQHLNEFLYDEATCISENWVSLGMLFWNKRTNDWKKKRLLLKIDCGHLMIKEDQRDVFMRLFGADKINIFDAFWIERRNGIYFDYSSAFDFVIRYK